MRSVSRAPFVRQTSGAFPLLLQRVFLREADRGDECPLGFAEMFEHRRRRVSPSPAASAVVMRFQPAQHDGACFRIVERERADALHVVGVLPTIAHEARIRHQREHASRN